MLGSNARPNDDTFNNLKPQVSIRRLESPRTFTPIRRANTENELVHKRVTSAVEEQKKPDFSPPTSIFRQRQPVYANALP